MKKIITILAVSAVMAGCASRPESISASFVSHEKYVSKDCVSISIEMSNARSELAKYSSMQDSKANLDAATVFLALIPASKLTGDHAGDVAKWKGEIEAIETALIKAGCKK